MDINIVKSDFYVFVVHYISHTKSFEKVDLYVHRELASIHIVPCKYQFGCRQVAMKPGVNVVKVFDVDKGQTPLNLFTSKEAHIAIVSGRSSLGKIVIRAIQSKTKMTLFFHS